MNTKKHQSVAPFYAVGALWVLAGLALPLYRLSHIAVMALVSLVLFLVVNALAASAKPIGEEKAEVKKEEPKKEASTGNPELDKMLKEGNMAISEMKRLDDNIDDAGISADIVRLEEISRTDREIWATGRAFAGIDEAGRGPLCGPVAAACVVMPPSPLLLYVDDSKKLTEKRREALYDQILETAVYAKVILASPEEIDRVNILNATKNAMALAAKDAPCDLFLVDAIDRLDVAGEVRGIVHGDALSYSIGAASIVAKVYRDALMDEFAKTYPVYGFERNKGYGTAEHIKAIKEYGICPIHRRTFTKKF